MPTLRTAESPPGGAPLRLSRRRPDASPAEARERETRSMVRFRDTGSPEAFEELYARARAPLFAWILHLCAERGLRVDPADLLQDTFVNVYRYAGGFDEAGGATFRGWARAIAANVVRRAAGRSRALSLAALPEGMQEPFDHHGGPDVAISSGEQSQALSRAWVLLLLHYARAHRELSGRDRRALEMIEVEERSYAEAGQLLRVGRSNMKMIVFRARRRLREHMLRRMHGLGSVAAARVAERRRAG